MTSNNSNQKNDEFSGDPCVTTQIGEVLINGVPVEQLKVNSDMAYDPKRVFVIHSINPDDINVKARAQNIKKAWEKLYGENTCEVAVLLSEERIESLV